MGNKKIAVNFIWKVASSHVIAYFIAGIFAITCMNYREHYASESLSLLMRQVDSRWVVLGPSLQIIRGIIIGLVLLPFRTIFLESKYGIFKLILLILGISFISTLGPTPGSFDGYIYTVLPIKYHLLGIPEAVLYTVLFSASVIYWHRYDKKAFFIISIIVVLLIALMSILGFMGATN